MSAKHDQDPWFVDEDTDQYLATLDLGMPAEDPPNALWARIAASMERVDSRLDEGRWRDFSPGIWFKRLWSKETILLRCEPGAVIPPHEHRVFEHTVVVTGDLIIEGETFGPGDYQGTPPGGIHPQWRTVTGCVVLVHYERA